MKYSAALLLLGSVAAVQIGGKVQQFRKYMYDDTFVDLHDNADTLDQTAYEQKVLEAAQNDPELMAALQAAAQEAGGSGDAMNAAVAQATEQAAKALVDEKPPPAFSRVQAVVQPET